MVAIFCSGCSSIARRRARCTGTRAGPACCRGRRPLYLDGGDWIANSSGSLTMVATVPGDVVTDLQAAGFLGDPLAFNNTRRTNPSWGSAVYVHKGIPDAHRNRLGRRFRGVSCARGN